MFFPSCIKIIRALSIQGLHAVAEKFFLYIISKELSAEGDILKIGSYRGSSSMLLALGNKAFRKKAKVWLIEPSPEPSKEVFLNNFSLRGFDRDVALIDKTSSAAEEEVDSMFRFIFVDGNHEYEYVKKDILIWGARLVEGGMIAFHNISREGVATAVNELIERSSKFNVQGVLADTLYASRGDSKDNKLISRFKKLNMVREKCIRITERLNRPT